MLDTSKIISELKGLGEDPYVQFNVDDLKKMQELVAQGYEPVDYRTGSTIKFGSGDIRPEYKEAYDAFGGQIPDKFVSPDFVRFQTLMEAIQPGVDAMTVWNRGESEIKLNIDNFNQNIEREKRMIQEDVNWIKDSGGENPEEAKKKQADIDERMKAMSGFESLKDFGFEMPEVPTEFKDVSQMEGATMGGVSGAEEGVWYKSPDGNFFQAPKNSDTASNFLKQGYVEATIDEAKAGGADTTEELRAYYPGSKGIYKGKEGDPLNPEAINELFKQYHERDANQQELDYWATKKVGDLEDTLAKTGIFSGEDADKIRAQMMAEGKTYIANQAELETLAKSGEVTPESLSQVGESSMLFTTQTAGTGVEGAPGDTTGTPGTTGEVKTETEALTGEDALIDQIADAVGDVNASDEDILGALGTLKETQIDPYYKQLIGQYQQDVSTSINRGYEDRIRQLQSESFNLAENIRGAQKNLEASGMTFSGEAIRQLGTLSAFGQGTPAGLTPAQLGQEGKQVAGGMPVMTPEQAGIEGSVNLGNRLMSESSRAAFNRRLEDIGQSATRTLGTEGVSGMGLPAQATAGQPQTTGTMQYDYNKSLQSLYGGLAGQEQQLTDYQRSFL